jgi:hypothetical protein
LAAAAGGSIANHLCLLVNVTAVLVGGELREGRREPRLGLRELHLLEPEGWQSPPACRLAA